MDVTYRIIQKFNTFSVPRVSFFGHKSYLEVSIDQSSPSRANESAQPETDPLVEQITVPSVSNMRYKYSIRICIYKCVSDVATSDNV